MKIRKDSVLGFHFSTFILVPSIVGCSSFYSKILVYMIIMIIMIKMIKMIKMKLKNKY